MSEIINAVERAIKKHGSLHAAARALDFQPSHLCRIRKGKHTKLSDKNLAKLGLKRKVYIVPR